MTPQELKNSILQLAIQGKLVEQRAEEGTGRELLEKILAAKNAKDAEKGKGRGRLTRSRGERGAAPTSAPSASPRDEIPDDEKPFDIPDSWEWVRLGELGILKSGYAFKSAEYTKDGIQVVRISDLGDDVVGLKDAVYYPQKEELSQYLIVDGSFLICMTGSIGKMAWVRDGVLRYLNQRVGMFIPDELCISAYIWFFLHTSYVIEGWIRAKTSTNGNIKNSDITELLIPLPPLAEQKRIVAKIEELLPLIDRYEKAWSRLESFNKSFPVDMQKSILQMAIQGKLVEQRAEEGTGRELLEKILAAKNAESTKGKGEKSHAKSAKSAKVGSRVSREEIPDDEKPFDIPESWEWVRVGDVCTNIQYGSSKKSASTGIVPVLRMGNIQNGKIDYRKLVYTSDEDEIRKYTLEVDDLLFNRTNSKELVGKVAIYKGEQSAIYAGYLVRLTPMNISADYLNYVMQSQYYWEYCQSVRSDAIGQSNINAEKLKCFVFPLPPLAEQKRIVAKLEELLPLCERLK